MEDRTVSAHLAQVIVTPRAYARRKELLRAFRLLRARNPVARVSLPEFDPFWVVSKYSDIAEVSRNSEVFRNGDRATALLPRAADAKARSLMGGSPHLIRTLVHMDAPHHSAYRRITAAWFRQSSLNELEAWIRLRARDAVDEMARRGETCDFVQDIASHLTLRVLLRLLGVPESDAPIFHGLAKRLFGGREQEADSGAPEHEADVMMRVFAAAEAYFTGLAQERRRRPQPDLVSAIANATVDGGPIPAFEAISYFVILATGGHDTTASAISDGVWALCERPVEFGKAKDDRTLIPALVAEAVRWSSPVQHFMRTAAADVELRGRRIRKGDWLMLSYLSGNRDEEAFDDASDFCIGHSARRNIGFGHGPHVCLGQHLATIQMRVFFEEFFDRVRTIELAGTPRRAASLFVGGPRQLPVRYTVA